MVRLRVVANSFALSVSLIVVFVAGSFIAGSAHAATWTKVAQFTGPGYVSSAYFFDRSTGLIGLDGSSTNAVIYITTDAGVTWRPVTTPVVSGSIWVSDIWFKDAREGWATYFGGSSLGNVWHTSDGGLTWNALNLWGPASSVRATSSALVVAQYPSSGIRVSTNQGSSFTTLVTEGHDGLDFVDDAHGVASGFLTITEFTADGGLTWASTAPVTEGWGVYGFKGTSRFLLVPENVSSTPSSNVYTSTDYGATWQQQSSMPNKMTGSVQGSGSVAYVQSYLPSSPVGGNGLYRTTDYGISWSPIGGPSNQFDSRFAVTECGRVIFAFDKDGGVYRSDDVADDLALAPCGVRSDTLAPMTAAICDSLRAINYLHSPVWDTVQLVALYVVDSLRAPYASTSVVLDSLPALPYQFLLGDSVAFRIAWRPHFYLSQPGRDSVIVRAIYRLKNGSHDTITMPLRLVANLSPAKFALDTKALRLDAVEHCSPRDTAVSITNLGCDSLWITTALLGPKSQWMLLNEDGSPVTLPIGVASGSTRRLVLRLKPVSSKSSVDSLKLGFRYQGHDSTGRITLVGSGKVTDALQAFSRVAFDSLATCATLDSIIWVPNASCDTVYLTAASLNSNDWNIFDTNGAALNFPIAIPPGSTRPLLLRFGPSKLGLTSGTLVLRYRYLQFDSTHSIPLSGAGKQAGSFDFGRALDFGAVSVCSTADTAIDFLNSSCNPVTVDSLRIDEPFTLLDPGVLPAMVDAGKHLRIRIGYAPNSKTLATSRAIVKYFFNGAFRYDTIEVRALGTGGSSICAISPGVDSIRFVTRSECGDPDSVQFSFSNAGCDSLWIERISGSTNPAIHLRTPATPVALLPGDTGWLRIVLDSLIEGDYQDTIRIAMRHADGQVSDTSFVVRATIAHGPRTLAIDTSAIQLGSVTLCELHDTMIVYTNTGCLPVSVLGWRMTDFSNGFNVYGTGVSPPIRLLPGESDTLFVHCPQTPGTYRDSVVVGTDADGAKARTIPVVVDILPPDSISFRLSVDNSNPKPGDIVTLRVYPERAISGKGVRTFDADIQYYEGLEYIQSSVQSPYTVTLGNEQSVGRYNQSSLRVSDANEIVFDPSEAVATMKFRVVVSDSASWSVRMRNVRLNSVTPSYALCTLSAGGAEERQELNIECGNDLLIANLQGKPLLTVEPAVPNPVGQATGTAVRIPMRSEVDGRATVVVFDVSGKEVLRTVSALKSGIRATETLDISHLGSGSYRYSVHFESDRGDGIATGALEVIR